MVDLSTIDADAEQAHVRFSAACFNAAWDLIVTPDRTPAQDEEMIRLNQASLYHWSQRPDCEERHWSIGYWQASRIRSLLGRTDEALRYARLCLAHSLELEPVLLGFAEEALARATLLAGDAAGARKHVERARALAAVVVDADDRRLLLDDLVSLG